MVKNKEQVKKNLKKHYWEEIGDEGHILGGFK